MCGKVMWPKSNIVWGYLMGEEEKVVFKIFSGDRAFTWPLGLFQTPSISILPCLCFRMFFASTGMLVVGVSKH